MSQNLTANEWGFSVEHDNPFAIFRYLQKIAVESVGEENVIDLSRGDPGYGFTPSVRGRRFYSFLLELDVFLNSGDKRFLSDFALMENETVLGELRKFAESIYRADYADLLMRDLRDFVDGVKIAAKRSDLEWSDLDIFNRIFGHCAVSGGCYLNPQGEEISRVVIADWYSKFISSKPDFDDLILFNGASHAIGTLFKALGKEGLGVLVEGKTAAICSPAYSPYYSSLINRNVDIISLSVDPLSGEISDEEFESVSNTSKPIDVFILIDPNNPTGFSLDDSSLSKIAEIARKNDAIIITDEVYCSFFPQKKTVIDYCPERTVRIDARSKVERSTGLRFGDVLVLKEFNAHGVQYETLTRSLMACKGPGGTYGEFQHTTFVPGPSQFLGISHMVLGEDERIEYVRSVKGNGEAFCNELGLAKAGNLYYLIFDLNNIRGCNKGDVPIERKLLDLAEKGVIYLPVYLFFPENKRSKTLNMNMVRVSVVNTSRDRVQKAAQITKNYLTS